MRRQGSKIAGTLLGAAITLTLLCWSSCLAPSSAQSPMADGGAAFEPPRVSLNFRFDDKLSDDTVGSDPQIAVLARALSSQDLKGSTFVIACHERASGHPEADQALAERCAETVKRVLVGKFELAAEALIAVGFGSSKPKNPADPAAIENQRLEILNMRSEPRPAVSR